MGLRSSIELHDWCIDGTLLPLTKFIKSWGRDVPGLRSFLAEARPSEYYRRSLLHTAALAGHVRLVRALLSIEGYAADALNLQDETGATPLLLASRGGCLAVVLALLAADADPYIADNNGYTALMVAAGLRHQRVVASLLDHPSSPAALSRLINATTDMWGETALWLSVWKGHTEVAALLVARGADYELVGTPAYAAHTDSCAGGEEAQTNVHVALMTPVQLAESRRDEKILKVLGSGARSRKLVKGRRGWSRGGVTGGENERGNTARSRGEGVWRWAPDGKAEAGAEINVRGNPVAAATRFGQLLRAAIPRLGLLTRRRSSTSTSDAPGSTATHTASTCSPTPSPITHKSTFARPHDATTTTDQQSHVSHSPMATMVVNSPRDAPLCRSSVCAGEKEVNDMGTTCTSVTELVNRPSPVSHVHGQTPSSSWACGGVRGAGSARVVDDGLGEGEARQKVDAGGKEGQKV